MIANSECSEQVPRRVRGAAQIVARLGTALLVAATAGIILDATAAPVRLVEVMTMGDGLLIESSEPAPYTVSRPDSKTLIVDMRNVSVADARSSIVKQGAISDVRLEQATSSDGKAIARVHVALTRASEHVVRSARTTIRIELTPSASQAAQTVFLRTSAPTAAARPPASTPLTVRQQPAATAMPLEKETAPGPATIIERIRSSRSPSATTVTLVGNGRLAPSGVVESKDKPRRLVLDFPNVTSKAPTQTAI